MSTKGDTAGLSKRVETDGGLAGEMQRLLLDHSCCPQRATPFVKFVYANADVLLAALRLVED